MKKLRNKIIMTFIYITFSFILHAIILEISFWKWRKSCLFLLLIFVRTCDHASTYKLTAYEDNWGVVPKGRKFGFRNRTIIQFNDSLVCVHTFSLSISSYVRLLTSFIVAYEKYDDNWDEQRTAYKASNKCRKGR